MAINNSDSTFRGHCRYSSANHIYVYHIYIMYIMYIMYEKENEEPKLQGSYQRYNKSYCNTNDRNDICFDICP